MRCQEYTGLLLNNNLFIRRKCKREKRAHLLDYLLLETYLLEMSIEREKKESMLYVCC